MASAGRVLLISKGTWASGSSYKPMDFVYYGGNSYLCKAAVSGSTDPSRLYFSLATHGSRFRHVDDYTGDR